MSHFSGPKPGLKSSCIRITDDAQWLELGLFGGVDRVGAAQEVEIAAFVSLGHMLLAQP